MRCVHVYAVVISLAAWLVCLLREFEVQVCVHCVSTLDSVVALPPKRLNIDVVASLAPKRVSKCRCVCVAIVHLLLTEWLVCSRRDFEVHVCVHCASTFDSVASLPPKIINIDGVASLAPKRVRSAGVCPLCIFS